MPKDGHGQGGIGAEIFGSSNSAATGSRRKRRNDRPALMRGGFPTDRDTIRGALCESATLASPRWQRLPVWLSAFRLLAPWHIISSLVPTSRTAPSRP